eukprot:11178827-Lingulodinium_polyedra.AAC.1
MAGQGQWTMFLQEYMNDMEVVDERSRQGHAGRRGRATSMKPADEFRENHEKVVVAVHGDCVSRARREVEQQERPERSQETADEMFELACRPVEAEEEAELSSEVQRVRDECKRVQRPKRRDIIRRKGGLRAGAAPGASGFRNRHLLMLLDMTMGLDTVADFTQHAANGRITGEARRLWYAAVLEPVDQGLTPEGKRKIRPI